MRRQLILSLVVFGLLAACRSDTVAMNVRFDRSPDLAQGDRVWVADNDAGRVTAIIRQADGDYVVGVQVLKSFAPVLTGFSRGYVIDDPERPEARALEIRTTRQGGASLAEGATMEGVMPEQDTVARLREELEKGLESFERRLRGYGRDLEKIPETEAYQSLKKALREWFSEMERAGDEAREKLEKKWLPRIQRELEELRERLEKNGGARQPPQDRPEPDGAMIEI